MVLSRNSGFVLRLSLSLLFAFLLAFPISAGQFKPALSQYVHEEWQTDKGIPQNSVWSVVQDANDFLWLGTENGLVRFDGVQFEVFNEQKGSLKDGFISHLVLARDGTLWGGMRDGGIFAFRNEQFTFYNESTGLGNDQVWCLEETDDGAIWAGSRNGLFRLENGTITTFTTTNGLPNAHVTSLASGENNDLWVGTVDGTVSLLRNGRITDLKIPNHTVHSELKALLYDKQTRRLWIGHDGDGLFCYENGVTTPLPLVAENPVWNIQCLYLDRDRNLWIGTQHNGAIRYDNGTVSIYGRKEGLSSDFVQSIYQDNERNLWIGTAYGGLNRLRQGAIKAFTQSEGLAEDNINCVVTAPDGTLYFSTARGGVYHFTENYKCEKIPVSLGKNGIDSLLLTRNGVLWIGSGGGGLAQYDNGAIRYESAATGMPYREITSLYEDSHSNIWVGSKSSGISLRRNGSKTWQRFAQDPNLRDYIRCFKEDENGTLWVGTQRHLLRFDDGEFQLVSIPGIAEPSIRWIVSERKSLWMATRDNGIIRMENGAFQVFPFDIQTPIYHLIHRGDEIWFNSNRGIERVAVSQFDEYLNGKRKWLHSELFNERDGMKTSECSGGFCPSACESPDGHLWYATRRGLAMVDNDEGPVDLASPTAFIRAFLIDGREGSLTTLNSIPRGSSRLEFQFTAPSLSSPLKTKFEYRLRGLDDNWVQAGQRREAVFYKLAPGTYKFQVAASTAKGLWSNAPAEIAFVIPKAIYQQTWFYVFGFTALALLIRGVHRWRVRRVSIRANELEQLVVKRTSEIQSEVQNRIAAERELVRLNNELEEHVARRTDELRLALDKLKSELNDRVRAERALGQSEARFRRIVESGIIGILFWDENGLISEANPAFLNMIGYSETELKMGQIFWNQLTPPEYAHLDQLGLEEIRNTGACSPFEKEFIRKDGSRFPVLIGGASFHDSSAHGVCFVLDISERKQAEEEIRSLNVNLEARVNQRTFELEQNKLKLELEIYERNKVAFALASLSQLGQKLHSAETEKDAAQIIAKTAEILIAHDHCSIALYGKDHQLYPVIDLSRTSSSLLPVYRNSTISVSIRNGTRIVGVLSLKSSVPFNDADKDTLQALGDYCGGALERIHAEEALHKLPQQIIQAQEMERRRVARELHDGVNQAIASIKFRIQTAEQQILRGDSKWEESCKKSKEMLDSVLEQVRRLSRNLRPGELDDFGLLPAIRSACQDFRERTGLELELNAGNFEERLPALLELSLYRILQEALTNIEKHSKASRVSVRFIREGPFVTLEIHDDGQGIPQLNGSNHRSGLGLLHMRERTNLVGGSFTLLTNPGEGLRIRIHAPINEKAQIEQD